MADGNHRAVEVPAAQLLQGFIVGQIHAHGQGHIIGDLTDAVLVAVYGQHLAAVGFQLDGHAAAEPSQADDDVFFL